jgi:hypothetical protein
VLVPTPPVGGEIASADAPARLSARPEPSLLPLATPRANPKSPIFSSSAPSWFTRKMLCGFRSRCTTPCSWIYAVPASSYHMHEHTHTEKERERKGEREKKERERKKREDLGIGAR